MDEKNESSVRKTIQFSLIMPELPQDTKLNITGLIVYALKKGLIVTTDYSLEQGQVLHFSERINGYQFGVVRSVVDCGKIYMAKIDYK